MKVKEKSKKSLKESEVFSGILLIVATLLALIFVNSPLHNIYKYVVHDFKLFGEVNLHFIVNDFLMAIFFLVVGCEIKREFVYGKLSNFKDASFPIICAVGGMAVPAIIFTLFNYHTQFEIGVGIPLSTDIAFAIGIFAILEKRIDKSLKVFLLTLAVVDDLLSIVIIGLFYTSDIKYIGIIGAIVLTGVLLIIRRIKKINNLYSYLIVGFFLWVLVLYSGIHATLSGVILAFTIPVYDESKRDIDLSYKLQHKLEGVTNMIILPLFAFVNTGIDLRESFSKIQDYTLIFGIVSGLVIGKPLGIMLFGYLSNLLKISTKPQKSSWYSVFIVSVIAGIGFTMSLFIAQIAFTGKHVQVNEATISILIAVIISTILAFVLTLFNKKTS